MDLRPNPFKVIRQERGLTQQQLADEIGSTRLLVLRAEQGLYALPPPHLASHLANISLFSYEELLTIYRDWQRDTRRYYGPNGYSPLCPTLIGGFSVFLDTPVAKQHPLVKLREINDVSQIRLCIELCVNPGPIHKWESFKQRTMPSQLLYAMREAGYSDRDIEALETAAEKAWQFNGK